MTSGFGGYGRGGDEARRGFGEDFESIPKESEVGGMDVPCRGRALGGFCVGPVSDGTVIPRFVCVQAGYCIAVGGGFSLL